MPRMHINETNGARATTNRNLANWLMVGGVFAVLGSAALSLVAIGISVVVTL
jgi:hypothetical protein